MEIEVCDDCEQKEKLYVCQICEKGVFCIDCISEHLESEHGEDIIDEVKHNYIKET